MNIERIILREEHKQMLHGAMDNDRGYLIVDVNEHTGTSVRVEHFGRGQHLYAADAYKLSLDMFIPNRYLIPWHKSPNNDQKA